MTTHTDRHLSPYNTQQLFDLVADVARYPEFLPWCRAARILERGEGWMRAELVISFAHLSESYESKVILNRPSQPGAPGTIEVTMTRGPFSHLVNRWEFLPRADGQAGSEIVFFIDFAFRSRLLASMLGSVFHKAVARMSDAFEQRAHALYGP